MGLHAGAVWRVQKAKELNDFLRNLLSFESSLKSEVRLPSSTANCRGRLVFGVYSTLTLTVIIVIPVSLLCLLSLVRLGDYIVNLCAFYL